MALNRSHNRPEPPRDRQDWPGSHTKLLVIVLWAFAVLWNGATLPVLDEILVQVPSGSPWAIAGLLIPLFGVGLVVAAIRRTVEWRRFGEPTLTMNPPVATVGGVLGGHLALRLPDGDQGRFVATLSCLHEVVVRGRSEHTIVWQDQRTITPQRRGAILSLGFQFAIPEQLPPSSPPPHNDYLWNLHLSGALEGVNLDRHEVDPKNWTVGFVKTEGA
ncbi:MAG: hypothetical protein COX57_05145 [Alphaproteobacteria bacterium CG_4_10_14_0_2_um_filter_63_37]|nr:MAG: hypothetical protein AUJ55_05110 [Proteobacteria bacterium CG1_02_64_396]PJA25114.1 MAG: hypothetical protein COX57_05145 [Alphaproteobacteria bacterium CG_4_10_14_0_2_um_filter_63_37]